MAAVGAVALVASVIYIATAIDPAALAAAAARRRRRPPRARPGPRGLRAGVRAARRALVPRPPRPGDSGSRSPPSTSRWRATTCCPCGSASRCGWSRPSGGAPRAAGRGDRLDGPPARGRRPGRGRDRGGPRPEPGRAPRRRRRRSRWRSSRPRLLAPPRRPGSPGRCAASAARSRGWLAVALPGAAARVAARERPGLAVRRVGRASTCRPRDAALVTAVTIAAQTRRGHARRRRHLRGGGHGGAGRPSAPSPAPPSRRRSPPTRSRRPTPWWPGASARSVPSPGLLGRLRLPRDRPAPPAAAAAPPGPVVLVLPAHDEEATVAAVVAPRAGDRRRARRCGWWSSTTARATRRLHRRRRPRAPRWCRIARQPRAWARRCGAAWPRASAGAPPPSRSATPTASTRRRSSAALVAPILDGDGRLRRRLALRRRHPPHAARTGASATSCSRALLRFVARTPHHRRPERLPGAVARGRRATPRSSTTSTTRRCSRSTCSARATATPRCRSATASASTGARSCASAATSAGSSRRSTAS